LHLEKVKPYKQVLIEQSNRKNQEMLSNS